MALIFYSSPLRGLRSGSGIRRTRPALPVRARVDGTGRFVTAGQPASRPAGQQTRGFGPFRRS